MPRRRPPELTFQKHVADFLVREHKYGVLQQRPITLTDRPSQKPGRLCGGRCLWWRCNTWGEWRLSAMKALHDPDK